MAVAVLAVLCRFQQPAGHRAGRVCELVGDSRAGQRSPSRDVCYWRRKGWMGWERREVWCVGSLSIDTDPGIAVGSDRQVLYHQFDFNSILTLAISEARSLKLNAASVAGSPRKSFRISRMIELGTSPSGAIGYHCRLISLSICSSCATSILCRSTRAF